MTTLSTSKYFKAHSVQDAIALAKAHTNFIFLAGGTDAMVNKQQGTLEANTLIDISDINELNQITSNDEQLIVGSMNTLHQIASHHIVATRFPALREAALSVATPVIRRSATIGGNLLCENRCSFYNQSEWWREAVGYCLKCNGDICIATGGKKNCFSRFVSDTAPVLIALQACATISDGNTSKQILLENLYSGDGVNPHSKSNEQLLIDIRIPFQPSHVVFRKLRPRKSLDFTSLSTAVALYPNQIRVVIGGVDPQPVLLTFDGTHPHDDVIAQCVKKPRIVDNDFYSRKYRKEMIGHFIRESLSQLSNMKF